MTDALVFALPERPDRGRRHTHWWRVVDGDVVDSGAGEEWLAMTHDARSLVALAPAGPVRLSFSDVPGSAATPRQAAAVARVAAVEASLGDEDSLHAVSDVTKDGSLVTALVDKSMMGAWLDWARELGAEPHHVVPVGALLPMSESWAAMTIGAERIVGRRGAVIPDEPELAALLVGDAEVRTLENAHVQRALAEAAENFPLDLRTGRFARRRGLGLDRRRIRELILLAAVAALLTLAWAIVSIVKLDRSTDRLNAESLGVAAAALGRPATLDTVESELAQRTGGSAYGGVMAPLTATYQALEPEPGVSSTRIAYAPDGTLSVTLAAPTVDAVNRVLLALQRNGYRVTAVPRQSPDGRQMVDVTVRGGP